MDEKLMTVADVASYLQVDRITIYRYVKEKKLACVRLANHTIRFKPQFIEDFLAAGGQVQPTEQGVDDAGRAVQR